MSLSSLLSSAETKLESINPIAIAKATEADVAAIKSDILEVRSILVAWKPAIEELLSLLPANVAVPAAVLTLLAKLPNTPAPKAG